ncbi:MAG: hypothetical protein AAF560_24090 [Acidobacteriota bacterium]
MNRKLIAVFVLAFLISTAASAQPLGSAGCYIGPGLAATLLFPYFEVDLGDPLGVGTLLAINNGFNAPTLARFVMWTDWGVPTLAFDLYLPPFDVETINVGDLFNGTIPSTGEGVNLAGFDGCDTDPPSHNNPVLSADDQAQLVADHLGQVGPFSATCAGSTQGDQIARGYITVDVVRRCSGVEPGDPTTTPANTALPYFTDGGGAPGVATTSNILWGDVIYVDANNSSAQGSEALPIWASPGRFAGTDIFTFYGRFSNWDGRDDRVPLPGIWNQRYLNGGPFAGGADLIVWRDPTTTTARASCGLNPAPFPLEDVTVARDLEGNSANIGMGTSFPLATQRVSIDSLGVPFTFGYLQVETSLDIVPGQAWIQPSLSASNLFSANFNGTPVGFLCAEDPTPPILRPEE